VNKHWKKEWNKTRPPKLQKWSPKVDDPRQIDMFDYKRKIEVDAGFDKLDAAIRQAEEDAGIAAGAAARYAAWFGEA